jgi:hypothetical protein
MKAPTFIPAEQQTQVNKLIDSLLAEPFSVSQKLEDETLESLQVSFEELEDAYSEGAPPHELADLHDSYLRSKEIFCLLLMELEALGATGHETLHDLRHREAGTQLLTPQLQSSRQAPNLTLVPPPAEATLAAPSEQALFTDIEAPKEIEKGPAFEAEAILWSNEISQENESLAPVAAAPENVPEIAAAPAESEGWPLPEVSQAPAPAPAPTPVAEAAEEIAPADEPPVPVAAPAPRALDPRAKHFLALAGSFEKQGSELEAERFEIQSRLFAIECELWARLRPAVELFWVKKESAIRELLDSGNKRFDFHPLLKKGLEALAKEGAEFLPRTGLPHGSLLNSVRFLMSGPDWETFWPLPIELGMLILLFGGERAMRGLILRNHLNVRGLTESEAVEAAFRLMRCQSARNRVLSPIGAIPDRESVRDDVERLLELAGKLEAGQGTRGDRE